MSRKIVSMMIACYVAGILTINLIDSYKDMKEEHEAKQMAHRFYNMTDDEKKPGAQ